MTPVALPIAYDPKAQCPGFLKYLEEVLPDADTRLTVQEMMGLLLVPDNSHQKAFLLCGEGGYGKSGLFDVCEGLLGKSNYSTRSLAALSENTFAAADLHGKLANLCSDISANELSSTALFRAITGGDAISGEKKFKDSFSFVPFARLMFSANRFPTIQNPTNALFDRWIVIRFNARKYRDTPEQIKDLGKKLIAAEGPGILNYALAGLNQLNKAGHFTVSSRSREALDDFRVAADTVALFLRELKEGWDGSEPVSVGSWIKKPVLKVRYQEWCALTDHSPLAQKGFFERAEALLGEPSRRAGYYGWIVR